MSLKVGPQRAGINRAGMASASGQTDLKHDLRPLYGLAALTGRAPLNPNLLQAGGKVGDQRFGALVADGDPDQTAGGANFIQVLLGRVEHGRQGQALMPAPAAADLEPLQTLSLIHI